MRGRWQIGAGGIVASILAATVCSGQADSWAPVSFPDPLRFSSLPVSGTDVSAPAAGQWEVSTALDYFNVWQRTWHTARVHQVLGLAREPLTDGEIKILEQNFPRDQFYHIDVEGWRNDFVVSRGFDGGIAATLRVPWVEIGGPRWDAIAEDFHAKVGLGDMARDLFPHGQSTVYVRGHRAAVERLSGLEGSGIGDVSFSVTGPLGRWLGAEHRWAVAVEAPTGEAGTLRGSGGWDKGVRWFGTWGQGASQFRAGIGYSWLDPTGSWLGVKRDNIWGALLEARAPLGRRLTLRGSARFDSSPLAGFTESDIGMRSFYWTVGMLAPIAGGSWVAFDLGENYGSNAEVPDFSLHLQLGLRFPPSR
ncbi:MAG: hypothetical protein A2Y78_10305 [Acidobacteria bacterium RBG_13_68_16]|nr:MAG: hypothetical protein A2Y78_10305 [Acidobacteria bacterium RBG_13_68_16]